MRVIPEKTNYRPPLKARLWVIKTPVRSTGKSTSIPQPYTTSMKASKNYAFCIIACLATWAACASESTMLCSAFAPQPRATSFAIPFHLQKMRANLQHNPFERPLSPPKSSLSMGIDIDVTSLSKTLLATTGTVPLLPAFALNSFLFLLLRSKLSKMLIF